MISKNCFNVETFNEIRIFSEFSGIMYEYFFDCYSIFINELNTKIEVLIYIYIYINIIIGKSIFFDHYEFKIGI